jgi:asparagine synthase (glutamine-hydrolysing)
MIDFSITISKSVPVTSLFGLFTIKPPLKLSIVTENIEFIAWGDPIYNNDFRNSIIENATIECVIDNLYGHYYYILLNKTSNNMFIGNSIFSILPVYFTETNNSLRISNDPFFLQNEHGSNKYNKRFLLENILFYYPIFNQSCIKGVNLLCANNYIQVIDGKATSQRHTAIEKFFSASPIPWRKASDYVSDLFIESSKKYFPDEQYASALTGGFDGRTLAACGLYNKNKFMTYSFGSEESADVKIAQNLSNKAGIEFLKIDLNEDYLNNHSLNTGLDFIRGSSGNGSFARAHYLYATKKLSEKTNYLITGNFGSEVFRAARNSGVVISPNLYMLLTANNFDEAVNRLENTSEWEWITKSEFKDEWGSLKEELNTLPCFAPEYKNLTKNQQFYKIVFDEVFRKYFGAEMVNQYKYIANRTPFLDIDFLKGILRTGLAGVNSDYFTNNPLKRYKGQVLYAYIIRKTYPAFGKEMTDKGYRPEDLLSFEGMVKISGSFISKKIRQKIGSESDPFAVDGVYSVNKDFWQKLDVDPSLFNVTKLRKAIQTPCNRRDSLFIALSQAYYYNEKYGNKFRQQ